MAFKFPFTNYHELNLTWVLEKLKDLFEASARNVEEVETYNDRLTAVEEELPGIEATASAADQTANAAATLSQTAKTTADNAHNAAITAASQAGQAMTTANNALSKAEAAKSEAETASNSVINAQATANEALTKANTALNLAGNSSQALEIAENVQGELYLKADAGNILKDIGEFPTSFSGFTISWNANKTRAHITGSSPLSSLLINIFNVYDGDSVPTPFEPGKEYNIVFKSSDSRIRLYYIDSMGDHYVDSGEHVFIPGTKGPVEVSLQVTTRETLDANIIISIPEDLTVALGTHFIEHANNKAGLTGSNADVVLVQNNNSAFGDGGACFFETTEENQYTITRSNGTYLRPIISQGNLFQQNVNVRDLLKTMSGYIGNQALLYGNYNTLFNETCTNEIDCSSFVVAVLNGISYNNSRYVLGTEALNKVGFGTGGRVPNKKILSMEIASWFAQHKQLYDIGANGKDLVSKLQAGDILFSGSGNYPENIYGISHVAIVLATAYPRNTQIVIAQAGGLSGEVTQLNNTVCKISIIDCANMFSKLKAFARPNYGMTFEVQTGIDVSSIFGSTYHFNTACIPGCFITSDGERSISSSWSTDQRLFNVVSGRSIKNNTSVGAYVAFYDENKTFIRRASLNAGGATIVDANAVYAMFAISTPLLSVALTADFTMT